MLFVEHGETIVGIESIVCNDVCMCVLLRVVVWVTDKYISLHEVTCAFPRHYDHYVFSAAAPCHYCHVISSSTVMSSTTFMSSCLSSCPQHLVNTAKVDIRQFSDANADANKYKNRFMNFLPCTFPH